ncbi:MAG: hypothetical protein ACE147_01265 [Candidatus Methylomirabilales bacterium]
MSRCEDGRQLSRITDEQLEFYGELYLQHALSEVIDFENFLLDPERYLPREARPASCRVNTGRWRSLLGLLRIRPLARSPHA